MLARNLIDMQRHYKLILYFQISNVNQSITILKSLQIFDFNLYLLYIFFFNSIRLQMVICN
jgi:hypothetical protein